LFVTGFETVVDAVKVINSKTYFSFLFGHRGELLQTTEGRTVEKPYNYQTSAGAYLIGSVLTWPYAKVTGYWGFVN
jgi:hypothetical protein